MNTRRFTTLATAALGFTLLVIVWGAFVRATGAGAGCGSHWPTCHGQVVPRAPAAATVIEFTHRLTSGVALLLVGVQMIFSFKVFVRGHLARRAAVASLVFMLTEAMIGAGLVLYEKVAKDASLSRGWWMSAHLINTFVLLACLTTVVWAARQPAPPKLAMSGRRALLLLSGLLAVLVTGMTGAIAALGDTLFPAASFKEGLAMDAAPSAHLFVQLRAVHPFVAAGTALHLLVVASAIARSCGTSAALEPTRKAAQTVGLLVIAQMAVGIINLALAAPTAMQLVHLVVADLLWIALVVLTASTTSKRAELPPSDRRPAAAASETQTARP